MRGASPAGEVGWAVKRLLALSVLLLGACGCLRPVRTLDELTFGNTLPLHIEADLDQRARAGPLVQMPVDGGPAAPKGPRVAVVDVDGLLLNQNLTGPYSAGENPVDLLREKLDAVAADPGLCAVVLRLNSPGGSVTATDVMWQEVRSFRARTGRPVVVCLMDLGCGGAYYLASAGDLIVAHPTSVVGGVGVVLNLYNLIDFMNVLSIKDQSVRSGANADLGDMRKELPEGSEKRRLLQAMADEFHERFKAVVAQRRPDAADRPDSFDGRVFTASQALDRRLIDRVGYLEDALAAAKQLAGRPDAGAVLLHRCNDVARTPYAATPNVPLQTALFPASLPGAERSRLPTFLYLWQPDPTLERLGGR
jgi:protease-4